MIGPPTRPVRTEVPEDFRRFNTDSFAVLLAYGWRIALAVLRLGVGYGIIELWQRNWR